MNVKDIIPWKSRSSLARPSSLFDEPFLPMSRRLFDDLFERGFGREEGIFSPTIDVADKENEIEVTAELPGMEEKDIDITVDEHGLTLRGEKKQERKEEGENYTRMERSFGSFQRYVPLASAVDREKVKARFRNGVLKIHLPKTGEALQKAKRIQIEG
ncbi:MAG: Hsp20/alpha crystallin family protein [Opitutales bacterium]